jgi:predicted nucleotidyltransferase
LGEEPISAESDKAACERQAVKTGANGSGKRHPISISAIQAVVRLIAEKFNPERVILFGSYAYGRPRQESDVDLLVVMETKMREREQRLEISRALSPRPFPLDILVRTPRQLKERIVMGDFFLSRIVAQGRVLYERPRS